MWKTYKVKEDFLNDVKTLSIYQHKSLENFDLCFLNWLSSTEKKNLLQHTSIYATKSTSVLWSILNCQIKELELNIFNDSIKHSKNFPIWWTNIWYTSQLTSGIANGSLKLNSILKLHKFSVINSSKKNVSFQKITISNFIQSEWIILISGLIVEELIIDNYELFNWNLTIQNSIIKNLIIKNSDLWKMKFNWVKIKKTLTIENVTLNDCIFNGVEFPKDYRIEEINKDPVKIRYKKMKDNYRQLKFVMDKNGNYTEANHFYAKEMQFHMQHLEAILKNKKQKDISSLEKSWFGWAMSRMVWEKILLSFSKSISEFWNNWMRPIFFLFLLAISATNIKFLYFQLPWLLDNFLASLENFEVHKNVSIQDWVVLLVKVIWIWSFFILVNKVIKNYFYSSILIFSLIIQFFMKYPIIDNFINFLVPYYPLYGFDLKWFYELSILEKIFFIVYYILFLCGILLLQLSVQRKGKSSVCIITKKP